MNPRKMYTCALCFEEDEVGAHIYSDYGRRKNLRNIILVYLRIPLHPGNPKANWICCRCMIIVEELPDTHLKLHNLQFTTDICKRRVASEGPSRALVKRRSPPHTQTRMRALINSVKAKVNLIAVKNHAESPLGVKSTSPKLHIEKLIQFNNRYATFNAKRGRFATPFQQFMLLKRQLLHYCNLMRASTIADAKRRTETVTNAQVQEDSIGTSESNAENSATSTSKDQE